MAGKGTGADRSHRATSPEFEAWEDWYRRQDYQGMPWYSPRPSPWLVRAVREQQLPRHVRLLDVGCGTGTNVIWLSRRGFRAAGVDVSPTAIEVAAARARRAGVEVDLRVASADQLPFGRASFGAALDTGCFHSIPLRLREPYARELARVLRPDARFLLTWIPREVRTALGPPHRPSLAEVANAWEPWFVFATVEWHASGTPEAWKVLQERMGRCTALLVRRRGRQPAPS
ncbi:MAG: class I SAM-dependent methyltransferase [Thermoplasmata archaeon]